jgi:hypothetical protein
MGALTLSINNLHSCVGTADVIEIDDTRLSVTGFEGTFKNEGSRILLFVIGWVIRSVFPRAISFTYPLYYFLFIFLYFDFTLQELKKLVTLYRI